RRQVGAGEVDAGAAVVGARRRREIAAAERWPVAVGHGRRAGGEQRRGRENEERRADEQHGDPAMASARAVASPGGRFERWRTTSARRIQLDRERPTLRRRRRQAAVAGYDSRRRGTLTARARDGPRASRGTPWRCRTAS